MNHLSLSLEHYDVRKAEFGTRVSLVLRLSQLSPHHFDTLSDPPAMNQLLLHVRHEPAQAAVIGGRELPCDTCQGFMAQAPGYSIHGERDI